MMRMAWTAALAVLLAGSHAEAKGEHPLFADTAVVHLSIKGPIGTVTQSSADTKKVVPITVAVVDNPADTLPAQLSARGITRRAKDVCSFPPLRIEFTDKPPATSLFKGQKRLKLTTHCRTTEAYQQYYLLEYAAYRIYHLLTPVSFGVRQVQIDYADEHGKPIISRLGFLTEDADDVAKRNNLVKSKIERISGSQLDPVATSRMSMFEYMIGNLDWAATAGPAGTECCHNSKLLGAENATSNLVPIPYDFDFAGMVDAPYATPPAAIPLPSVRVRRYRGFCRFNAQAPAAAAELLAHRADIEGVLDSIPQLEAKNRAKAKAYLDGFFEQAASPAAIAKMLTTCVNL